MNISRLFASNILWRGTYLFTSLLVTVLMARYLQASTTGWLFYFISWLTFIFMAASLSMESAITYFVSTGEVKPAQMQSFALMWTMAVTVIIVGISFLYFKTSNAFAGRNTSAVMTVLFISGNMLITFYNALFYAKQNYKVSNLVFIAINLFQLFLLAFVMKNDKTLMRGYTFIDFYFFSYLLQGLVIMILFNVRYGSARHLQLPSATQVKKIVLYSAVAYGASLLFYLVTRVDYWLIEYFLKDNKSLGNYIQASRLVQLFQLLPALLAAAIFPIAASGYREQMKEGIIKLSRVLVAFYFMLVLLLILTGRWLFPFVFGSSFDTMYRAFVLLTPGLFALSLLALMAAYFAALNKVKWNLYASLAGLAVILTGDILLIPVYGINGAAVASSIGYIVCFATGYYYFHKETNINFAQLVLLRKDDFTFMKKLAANIKTK